MMPKSSHSFSDLGGLVYSTGVGRMCPRCNHAVTECTCHADAKASVGAVFKDGIVRVGRETAGRKGSGVTVVRGLALSEDGLQELARTLKARCGSGGTVKDGIIEIQGEHRDTIVAELQKRGYPAKRAG